MILCVEQTIMIKIFLVWLDCIAPALILIAIIYYFKILRLSSETIWLLYFAGLNFVINFVGDIYSEVLEKNNHLFFHIENIGNIIILSQFFKYQLKKKYLINALLFSFLALDLIYIIVNQSFYRFDLFGFFGCSLVFTAYSLMFYHGLIIAPADLNLKRLSSFWYVTAFFIYYTTCNFIFLVYPHFSKKQENYHGGLWQFNNIMLLLMSILLIKGVLCQAHQKKL